MKICPYLTILVTSRDAELKLSRCASIKGIKTNLLLFDHCQSLTPEKVIRISLISSFTWHIRGWQLKDLQYSVFSDCVLPLQPETREGAATRIVLVVKRLLIYLQSKFCTDGFNSTTPGTKALGDLICSQAALSQILIISIHPSILWLAFCEGWKVFVSFKLEYFHVSPASFLYRILTKAVRGWKIFPGLLVLSGPLSFRPKWKWLIRTDWYSIPHISQLRCNHTSGTI